MELDAVQSQDSEMALLCTAEKLVIDQEYR
jgi:hypothetical protein